MFCAQLREAFSDVLDVRSCISAGIGLDYGQVCFNVLPLQGLVTPLFTPRRCLCDPK